MICLSLLHLWHLSDPKEKRQHENQSHRHAEQPKTNQLHDRSPYFWMSKILRRDEIVRACGTKAFGFDSA